MSFENQQQAREKITATLEMKEQDENTLLDEFIESEKQEITSYMDKIDTLVEDGTISEEDRLELLSDLYDFLVQNLENADRPNLGKVKSGGDEEWNMFYELSEAEIQQRFEGLKTSFNRNLSELDARIKTQEILNSQTVQELLKEIQEEIKMGHQISESFFSSLNPKKEISSPLRKELTSLSAQLNIPISFYYFEDPSATYTSEQGESIMNLWEQKFNAGLKTGNFLSPVSNNSLINAQASQSLDEAYRKLLHVPDDENLGEWIQLSFDDNPVREELAYMRNGSEKSNKIKEKYKDIDIQAKTSERMNQVIQKISPYYKDLLPLITQIIFLPDAENPMSIGTTDLALSVSLSTLLDEKYPIQELVSLLEHEFVHLKQNLIVYKEQEEKAPNSMQSKLESIINGEIPKGYQIKVLVDKPPRFFWREQIPDDIFSKIATDPNNSESEIKQEKVDLLSDEDKKRLNDIAIYTGKKIVPKNGFIHPYATTVYGGEYFFNGRVSTNNFLVEQITTIMQIYNDHPDRFISEAYNVDPKIKRIVDEVLIPYGFLPDKL